MSVLIGAAALASQSAVVAGRAAAQPYGPGMMGGYGPGYGMMGGYGPRLRHDGRLRPRHTAVTARGTA